MKKYLYAALVMVVSGCIIAIQQQHITGLRNENESLVSTKHVLLDSVSQYRTKNGLQAAEIGEIRLTVEELKKYRADDLKLIESLKTNGRDIHHYTKVETVTHDTIFSVLRDSIYRRDTVEVPIKVINLDKKWYSIHGWIDGDTINGTFLTRSSLRIVETVKYKRFLGFLWKTNKVKNRKVDVVSLNPNETITDVEFIVTEN